MPGELLGLHTLSGGLFRKRSPGLFPEVDVEHEGSAGFLMPKLRTGPGGAVRVLLSQVVQDRRANEPSRGNPLRGSVRVDGVTFEGRQSKRESPSHCPCSTNVLPAASAGLKPTEGENSRGARVRIPPRYSRPTASRACARSR
jgi:hypothetical protein